MQAHAVARHLGRARAHHGVRQRRRRSPSGSCARRAAWRSAAARRGSPSSSSRRASPTGPEAERERVAPGAAARRAARRRGGDRSRDSDVADELRALRARAQRHRDHPRQAAALALARAVARSPIDEVIRQSGDIDVRVITGDAADDAATRRSRGRASAPGAPLAAARLRRRDGCDRRRGGVAAGLMAIAAARATRAWCSSPPCC